MLVALKLQTKATLQLLIAKEIGYSSHFFLPRSTSICRCQTLCGMDSIVEGGRGHRTSYRRLKMLEKKAMNVRVVSGEQ
jgi:hypothetical protein